MRLNQKQPALPSRSSGDRFPVNGIQNQPGLIFERESINMNSYTIHYTMNGQEQKQSVKSESLSTAISEFRRVHPDAKVGNAYTEDAL